jgi:hypothetical protein
MAEGEPNPISFRYGRLPANKQYYPKGPFNNSYLSDANRILKSNISPMESARQSIQSDTQTRMGVRGNWELMNFQLGYSLMFKDLNHLLLYFYLKNRMSSLSEFSIKFFG